jgi:hypothetical protein
MDDAQLVKRRDEIREEHAAAIKRHAAVCDEIARLSRELDKANSEIKARAVKRFETDNAT